MAFQEDYQAACFALDLKDRNKAFQLAQKALDQCKDDQQRAKCHVLMADAHRITNDLIMAGLSLRRAIDHDGLNPDLHHELGKLFHTQGNLTSARRELEQAVELNPESARTHHSLAVTLHLLKETDTAVEHLKKALKLDPNYEPASAHLRSFTETGQF